MEFTSDSESPDDFHFWTGVWTIAGALRRRVWIDQRKFQWTPNCYIILVGPPGVVTKSTTTRTGIRLLEQIQGVRFGPSSTTWQALTESLEKAVEYMKMTDDKGAEVLMPMSCLNIHVSELGTFLKTDDTVMTDVITDLWDGQLSTWGHTTRTTGNITIKNPWLNVIGCTTPAWIKQNVPEHVIGGGFMSRVVFVYGDKKRQFVPYPDEMIAGPEYYRLESQLVEDLREIAMMQGEYKLHPDARTWGRDWYLRHWKDDKPSHMASDRWGGYLSRKQTHMHKLAIILAAARSNIMVIEKDHLVEAEAILTSSERHMMKVFESVGMVDEARHVAELAAFVRAHSFLTADQLYSYVRNIMTQRDFTEALSSAVRGGLLKVVERNGVKGVTPSGTIH